MKKRALLLLLPIFAGMTMLHADLTLHEDTLTSEYRTSLENILLYSATAPVHTRGLWQQALAPVLEHLFDEESQQLMSEPPMFDEHQEYDLALALTLAEEDESTPTYITDSLLAIAGACTAPQRGPNGNKPKPAQTALNQLVRNSRQIEQQRKTLSSQRHLQVTQENRRRRQLSNRAKRAAKHKKRQEQRLAQAAGGIDLHSDQLKRDKDIESSQLRERTKAARNTMRQNLKNKRDAVRTEQEKKAEMARKRKEARDRRNRRKR